MMIQQGGIGFSSFRGSGPQTTEQALNFPRPPQSVVALLSGFDVQFVDADHHLHQGIFQVLLDGWKTPTTAERLGSLVQNSRSVTTLSQNIVDHEYVLVRRDSKGLHDE